MVTGMHVEGWGFNWILNERLPEFKIRMGDGVADKIEQLIGMVVKEPDKSVKYDKCQDVIKKMEDISVIVRMYNGSIQTVISVPNKIPKNSYQKAEFRASIPVLGEEEVIHEGVIFFNAGEVGCACFLPFFPKHYGKIKPMSKINLALELIPFEIKILKKGIFSKLKDIGAYAIKGESRPYKQEIIGKIIEKSNDNIYLIDAGLKYFCKIKTDIELKKDQHISIKGSIFGYINE